MNSCFKEIGRDELSWDHEIKLDNKSTESLYEDKPEYKLIGTLIHKNYLLDGKKLFKVPRGGIFYINSNGERSYLSPTKKMNNIRWK